MDRAVGEATRKITFAEMRESGVRDLLISCADYRCGRSIAISGDGWPEIIRLPISRRGLCAGPAASVARTCGQILAGTESK